jgi:glyoxylase-like metal-dependent hydrolase (beta-lactamase superfamily II)
MSWTEHADGVFSKRYVPLDLNVGAVVCGDGLLVIDTRAHHQQARELIEDLKEISRLPVKWVINTHHHWDHTFGNGEFYDAAIWGHERCARHLADHGMTMLRNVKALAPDQARWFDEVVLVPPAHTFADAATAEFGGRAVTMTHLGRGHTDNDIVVQIGDTDVVFAGDLIENGAPPAFGDAYPFEWPDTVDRLLEMVDGPVIPGHGETADRAFVGAQASDLRIVAEMAAARHADGMSAYEAALAGGPFPEATLREAFRRAWEYLS